MTAIVVEVGPATVRGPNDADAESLSAGIDAIDDELALVDERAVSVAELWRAAMQDVVGGWTGEVAVVCPTWWPSSRVDRVSDAARAAADDVVVLRRAHVLGDGCAVVEIAPDFTVVSVPGADVHVLARGDSEALVSTIPKSMPVVLDCPEGVAGALELASAIADHLRANGTEATIADPDRVRRSAEALLWRQEQIPAAGPFLSTTRSRRTTAVLAGIVLSAAVLCGGFAAGQDAHPSTAGVPMTLLAERRVGVMVPARWAVRRVTSGPGSARVQVVSPDDSEIALHVTQSPLPPHASLEQVAASVRKGLDAELRGVFVDFNPSGRRADRPVVTYRELRADHHITWFVMIDRSVRIAIGCQHPPERAESVRAMCDEAIRTAHAVF